MRSGTLEKRQSPLGGAGRARQNQTWRRSAPARGRLGYALRFVAARHVEAETSQGRTHKDERRRLGGHRIGEIQGQA